MEHLKILFLFSVSNEGFALNLVLCLKPSPCCSGPPGLVLLGTLGCVWWLIWVSQLGRWCNWHVVATGMLLNITRQSPLPGLSGPNFQVEKRCPAQSQLQCGMELSCFPQKISLSTSVSCVWLSLSLPFSSMSQSSVCCRDITWCIVVPTWELMSHGPHSSIFQSNGCCTNKMPASMVIVLQFICNMISV